MFFFNSHLGQIWSGISLAMDLLWRMGYAFGISLLTAWVIAPWIIKYLKRRKWEQVFRDQKEVRDLAQLHSAKARTPTMGGIIIVIATMSGTIFLVHWNFQVIVTLCTYLAVMFMGFIDDLAKVRAQNTRGIPGRMKLLIQFGLTLVIGGILYFNPDLYERYCVLPIPFSGYSLSITPFIFFIIFLFCVLAGTSNAVNLTDGLDGLVTSCAMPVIFFLGIVSFITGNGTLATLCQCPYIAGNGELGILCASLLGALIVFLWHNGYPASIFMGDTGSLSLGILIGMVAFLTNHPFHLMIGGGIFVLEALSDIIQVFSYKFRHQRRIFKMAPLHHHFELLGVHETKITRRFGIISGLLSLLSIVGLWHFWG